MKKIAVLVPFFTSEYALQLLSGISTFFQDKNVKLIVAKTEVPDINKGVYDYQYWHITKLLQSEEIDAYICISALYCSEIPQEQLEAFLRTFGNRPIVSMGVQLNLENSYTITTDSTKVYKEIVTHLHKVHGCKNIAFLSANKTNSEEAMNRFNAYKAALKENNLPFKKELVYEGYFTDFDTRTELAAKLPSKESVKFDGMVSANDLMVVGAMDHFKKIDVSVPDDVKIIGFDNAEVAYLSRPRLSTVNQNVNILGKAIGEVTMKLLSKKPVDKVTFAELEILYRQSCGCVDRNTIQDVYVDAEGKQQIEEIKKNTDLSNYMNVLEEKNNIITLMDMVKSSNTLRQFFYNFDFIVSQSNIQDMTVNLFDESIYLQRGEEFILPSKMEMFMYTDIGGVSQVFKPGIRFNPMKKLIPSEKYVERGGIYLIYPIFSAETNYGYLTAQLKDKNFSTYNVYLKIIINAISQACEYTRSLSINQNLETENKTLLQNNTSLQVKTITDELTGILNRHGFIEEGQRVLDILQETGKPGVVFFADMDGLKSINDTYGHKMGDKAIKLQAQVLKKAFRNSDIVGRLSGDEFAIVASGIKMENVPVIKQKILRLSKQISKSQKLPFELSISIGGVNLEASSALNKLLAQADKELYKEKHLKKNAKSGK